jgi:hypothetical protein
MSGLRKLRTPTVKDCVGPVTEREEDGLIYKECPGADGTTLSLSWRTAGGGKIRRNYRKTIKHVHKKMRKTNRKTKSRK